MRGREATRVKLVLFAGAEWSGSGRDGSGHFVASIRRGVGGGIPPL